MALVTFSGTMRTSSEARGIGADRARGGVRQRAEQIDAGLAGAHQQHLRGERRRLVARGRRLDHFHDLRLRFGERQFAGRRRGLIGGQVALGKRDFRVVLHRAGIGRLIDLLGRTIDRLERVEGRDGVSETRRRHRQGGRENRERTRFDHLFVADLDGRWRLEGLLGRDDVDRANQSIAFTGIDAFGLRDVLVRRGGEFRRFGERRLTIKVQIQRRTDQRQTANAGERDAGEPAQRNAGAFAALELANDQSRSAVHGRVRRRSVTSRRASRNERIGRPKSSRFVLSLAGKRGHCNGSIVSGPTPRAQREGAAAPSFARHSAQTMAVMRRGRRKVSRPAPSSPGLGAPPRAIATFLQKEFDSCNGVAYITRTGGVGALAADAAWNFGTMSRRAPPC